VLTLVLLLAAAVSPVPGIGGPAAPPSSAIGEWLAASTPLPTPPTLVACADCGSTMVGAASPPAPRRPEGTPAGEAGRIARTFLGVFGVFGLGLIAAATGLRWRELDLEACELALREQGAGRGPRPPRSPGR
jgi:hypothetical protein